MDTRGSKNHNPYWWWQRISLGLVKLLKYHHCLVHNISILKDPTINLSPLLLFPHLPGILMLSRGKGRYWLELHVNNVSPFVYCFLHAVLQFSRSIFIYSNYSWKLFIKPNFLLGAITFAFVSIIFMISLSWAFIFVLGGKK